MWKPTENFVVSFSDETADERSEEVMAKMVKELKMVANKYDFDIYGYGGETNMREFYVRLNQMIKESDND